MRTRVFSHFLTAAFCIASIAASSSGQTPDRTGEPDQKLVKLTGISTPVKTNPLIPRIEKVCPAESGRVAMRVLNEYGSMFAAAESVTTPATCVFRNEVDVQAFQGTIKTAVGSFGRVTIELQEAAMAALLRAMVEAQVRRLRITPLDGAIAGRRSYSDTTRLWNSRFLPALSYWTRIGKITVKDAEAARSMAIADQAEKVLEWESKGLLFGTGRIKSIFASTAPPGTSQHLSLLAFDVAEYGNSNVREILNRNGWYQTVVNDPPHFTYLGIDKRELPGRGLKAVRQGQYEFWIPDLGGVRH